MLDRLRLRLSLLYTFAALLLVAAVGAGGYFIIARYLHSTTDQALLARMALEFTYLNAPLPPGLALVAPQSNGETQRPAADLSATFVLPLDASGKLLYDPNPWEIPYPPDVDAVQAALVGNRDWRTIVDEDGTRVRLMTETLTRDDGPAVLQVGRSLAEQDALLRQLLLAIIALAAGSIMVVGWGSWWLAGRSVRPAQLAWQRQSAFIANASHELRAPLTLMRASAEVILRGMPFDHGDRILVEDVVSETDHMSKLVEDLLLLSRLDAQRLELHTEPIALLELWSDLERQMSMLAAERRVALTWQAGRIVVHADRVRLRQVVLILVDNALHHTPAGGKVTVLAAQDNRNAIITVRDTGNGIAAEHLPHIFERFYRGDSTRASGSTGNGLGLAIARSLIEAQHGKIGISSTVGYGTTVSITLPNRPPQAAKARG